MNDFVKLGAGQVTALLKQRHRASDWYRYLNNPLPVNLLHIKETWFILHETSSEISIRKLGQLH